MSLVAEGGRNAQLSLVNKERLAFAGIADIVVIASNGCLESIRARRQRIRVDGCETVGSRGGVGGIGIAGSRAGAVGEECEVHLRQCKTFHAACDAGCVVYDGTQRQMQVGLINIVGIVHRRGICSGLS